MITKERLKELIEQKKQVWKIYKDTCQGAYQVPAGLFGIGFSSQVDETTPFNELFETKEEAEWHKEFGNITRTEKLDLPTWEELVEFFKVSPIQNYEITFIADSLLYEFAIYDYDSLEKIVRIHMKGFEDDSWDVVFDEFLTKENYTLFLC